nr:diguanylate cyclase [Methylocucumis oryzae]
MKSSSFIYSQFSTSVHISLYPDDATDINQLIHIADQRMYQHKSSAT